LFLEIMTYNIMYQVNTKLTIRIFLIYNVSAVVLSQNNKVWKIKSPNEKCQHWLFYNVNIRYSIYIYIYAFRISERTYVRNKYMPTKTAYFDILYILWCTYIIFKYSFQFVSHICMVGFFLKLFFHWNYTDIIKY
jgi:hypothetical protein